MALSEKEKGNLMSEIEEKLSQMQKEYNEKTDNKDKMNVFSKIQSYYEEQMEKIKDEDFFESFGNELADKYIIPLQIDLFTMEPDYFVRLLDDSDVFVKKCINECEEKINGYELTSESDEFKNLSSSLSRLKKWLYIYGVPVLSFTKNKEISDKIKEVLKNYEYVITLFNKPALMKMDKIANEVNGSKKIVSEFREISKVIDSYIEKVNNKSNESKIKTTKETLELYERCRSNLKRDMGQLINEYPDKKDYFNAILCFMSRVDLKYEEAVKECLLIIKKDFLDNYKYDIEKNDLENENNKKFHSVEEQPSAIVSQEDVIRYAALSSTIDDYINDLKDEYPNLLTNSDESYIKDSEELDTCIEKLKGLSGVASSFSRPYDDIKEEFDKVRSYLKSKFNYEYRVKKNNRMRKVISAEKILLGLGGLYVGAVGFRLLISKIIYYSLFGISYADPKKVFTYPILLSLTSIAMIVRAVSRKEKDFVINFIERIIKNRHNKNVDRNIEGYIKEGNEEIESKRNIKRR